MHSSCERLMLITWQSRLAVNWPAFEVPVMLQSGALPIMLCSSALCCFSHRLPSCILMTSVGQVKPVNGRPYQIGHTLLSWSASRFPTACNTANIRELPGLVANFL